MYKGFAWATDEQGRVVEVIAKNLKRNPLGRPNRALQTAIGKEGVETDVGFHLIGDVFGGPINRLNVVPGNSNLNLSAFRILENSWLKSIQAGSKVSVRLKLNYVGSTKRFDSLVVTTRVGKGIPVLDFFRNRHGG